MTRAVFYLGWFFIKHQNGYVLTASQESEGSHVVISSLNTTSPDSQLWRYNEKGLLVNKQTGFSMEVHQGKHLLDDDDDDDDLVPSPYTL